MFLFFLQPEQHEKVISYLKRLQVFKGNVTEINIYEK